MTDQQVPVVERETVVVEDEPKDKSNKAEAIAIFAAAFAAISILTAIFAVGIAVRAAQRADDVQNAPAAASSGGGDGSTTVSMSEYMFSPANIEVPAGTTLTVNNDGTMPHDLQVIDAGIQTAMLDPGNSEQLDLSSLEPGEYEIQCTVAGHASLGMTGTLTIT